MEITRLHPEETEAVDELWTMWTTAREHDAPGDTPLSKRVWLADINNVHPEAHHEIHVARIDGRVVGFAAVRLPQRDNEHLMAFDAIVDPAFRHRGIATALLDRAVQVGKANGRRLQVCGAVEHLPNGRSHTRDGLEFLRARGFSEALAIRSRTVELAAIEGTIEQDLLDESWPHAQGYELVQWTGPTPDEHVDGAAALASRLMTDVPRGDLELNEEIYDAERYRVNERAEVKRGIGFTCTYIRHIDSGDLVAHSVIGVPGDVPQYGGQWITLVHPDHRGHRLGMIVKIENHRLLRRTSPRVRWIDTGNAEVNSHMVAINERLGFTEVYRHLEFQREI